MSTRGRCICRVETALDLCCGSLDDASGIASSPRLAQHNLDIADCYRPLRIKALTGSKNVVSPKSGCGPHHLLSGGASGRLQSPAWAPKNPPLHRGHNLRRPLAGRKGSEKGSLDSTEYIPRTAAIRRRTMSRQFDKSPQDRMGRRPDGPKFRIRRFRCVILMSSSPQAQHSVSGSSPRRSHLKSPPINLAPNFWYRGSRTTSDNGFVFSIRRVSDDTAP